MSEAAAAEDAGPLDEREDRIVVRKRPNWPKRIGKALLWLVAGLLLLGALLLVGINTNPGRRFVAEQIESLEFSNGMKIGVAEIEGSLYGAMTIRGLTLSDTRGIFFRAPVVQLDWRPFDYLNNHVDIRSLTAPRATLLRVPEFRATPPSDGPLLPDLDISVGRLDIDRLIVEPAVTGERRVGSVEGKAQIADGRAQIQLRAGVIGGEGRAGGDRLALNLDAVPEANRLALNLFVSAPRDGVLARLAGISDPVMVRVQGSGDWQRWNGQLMADLGGSAFARLAVTARDGTFGIRGPTRVAQLVEGPTAALLGPITNVALQSTWENRRADLNARLSSDAFTLVANGVADLGRSRFDDLRLNFGLLKPSVLAPDLAGRDLRALLTLDGDMRRPTVDYRVTATALSFGDTGVRGLEARGVARFGTDNVTVPIAARAQAITGLDTVAGGTLTNVRLDGDLAVDWPRILSENLRIRSDRIDATAIILADISSGLYTGAIDGRIDDYRIDGVGIFNLTTDADLRTLPGGGYGMTGQIRAQSTRLFNEGVRDFLGGNVLVSSALSYGQDGIIRFSNLRLNAPKLRVTDGRGSYAPDGRIAIQASGASSDYGPVEIAVSGTVSNPDAKITLQRPGFGLGISGLQADIQSSANGYRVQASGNSDYGRFTADVVIQSAAGPLTIDIRSASIAGVDVNGRVRQAAAGPFVGRLDAQGQGLTGTVQLSAAGRYQQLQINARARNAVLPPPANIAVEAAIVDARVILYDQPEIEADVQLAGARIGETEIAVMRAIVDYQDGRGSARLLAEGRSGVPFRVAANADLQPDLWRAAVRGRVNGVDFRTEGPARVVPRSGSYELLPTQIAFEQGQVRLAGTYGDALSLQARIDNLDLRLIDSFAPGLGVSGRAFGTVEFAKAANAFPTADARLAIRNFQRTTAASVSSPMDINMIAQLASSNADLRVVMRTRGTVVGRIQARADPLGPGRSWTERISGAPVTGGIRYIGPADTLFSFAGLADQRLSGPLGVAADFGCRVSSPCLSGVVRGRGLVYENTTYGTRLTDMELSGRFSGERLEIEQLTAQAGNGSVTGSGYINLAADRGYPASFDLRLDNARLADGDDLRATASGNVQLAKAPNQAPVLSGTVNLPSTRYQIVSEGAAQVPTLTGVRFKPPRGPPRVTGDAAPTEQGPGFGDVRLDLQIVAPSELFVSGMGLESEWRADLDVTGTSSAPNIAGTIDLIRGTLGFAGRSFELSEGQIRFVGGGADSARITLSAEETIEDVDVSINVTGSVNNPQISFSSTPGLPQDEIMSRILFGNSVGSLSAIQAVQLAASLNALRGSGGGLNPLGKLRSATGFDRLRILGPDDTSGRGTALAAGKYISDDIYLEVVTDARGFTATQLEVALSRSLSILSRAGGSGGTNINVRYRKTY